MVEDFEQPFDAFVDKNLETFAQARRIIGELDELVETAFGGVEAERVRDMVGHVAQLEHEADVQQHALLKVLLSHESQLTAGELYLWLQILRQLSQISNLSERLANRVRTMLEIK
jgi:predicted phosphate transport protein (TIGR00153 family)